VRLAHA